MITSKALSYSGFVFLNDVIIILKNKPYSCFFNLYNKMVHTLRKINFVVRLFEDSLCKNQPVLVILSSTLFSDVRIWSLTFDILTKSVFDLSERSIDNRRLTKMFMLYWMPSSMFSFLSFVARLNHYERILKLKKLDAF